MCAVWRPERRNRNIGTKASGHSKLNDMRIPESWRDKHGKVSLYYERLEIAHVHGATIGESHLQCLYENPHNGYSYGCSLADVIQVLGLAAQIAPAMPNIIAFRQPTRKQQQQFPVWGRFLYFAEFGKYEGTAIVLEAQKLGALLKRSKSMTLDERAEFERLVSDGHSFVETKRHFEAELTEGAVRNTKLYRTLLHELGHLNDYHQKVLDERTALDPDQDVAASIYFSRPTSEREVFAHAFAEQIGQSLRNAGEIPLDPSTVEQR